MSQDVLDNLGRKLISGVVDRLGRHAADLLNGDSYRGADWYEAKYEALRSLDPLQCKAVQTLLDDLGVSSLHAFLDILDKDQFSQPSEPGRLILKMIDDNGAEVDVGSISDGLAGELYGEQGWIARFSIGA